MSRPLMVLTGPQAITIGVLAGLAFTYRTSLRAAGHFLRCGPNLLGLFDDDCDEAEFVGANPDLYLGPIPEPPPRSKPSWP